MLFLPPGTDVSKEELNYRASGIWGPGKADKEDLAAMVLQRSALKRLLGGGIVLKNEMFLERIHLELQLQRGLRLLLLCMCMFAVVILAAVQERQGPARLGLLDTYKSLFQLDDSLADIQTIDGLFEYLRLVSGSCMSCDCCADCNHDNTVLIRLAIMSLYVRTEVFLYVLGPNIHNNILRRPCICVLTDTIPTDQSRLIMPTSSVYFAETSGELSVMRGVRAFQQAESVEVADLAPRIDRSKWTFVPLTLREHILENTF
jgi:hypothetical protein